MGEDYRIKLIEFYKQMNIYPAAFQCPHKSFCNQYAEQEMTEAKMSMVGSQYGKNYPRITVVSLDPPKGKDGDFCSPTEREIESVSNYYESLDFCKKPPKVHRAMTQIIVKDILKYFGFSGNPQSSVVEKSYSYRNIENVSAYFSQVNLAKCSMNKDDKGQANFRVHKKCAYSFLLRELEILRPQIIISQGKHANTILGNLYNFEGVEDLIPTTRIIRVGKIRSLWMPMVHPARHINDIRKNWSVYIEALQEWIAGNSKERVAF